MPPRRVTTGGDRNLVMIRPEHLPEQWYEMWDQLVSDMRRESESLPMNTMMLLMIERIATLYVKVRQSEDENAYDQEMLNDLNKLWLRMCNELGTQLHRHSQTPEQRFIAGLKSALNSAARTAGPDCLLRDFMPILAEHLREYDI